MIDEKPKTDVKLVVDTILKNQIPLHSSKDLDQLISAIGDSKYVLLGEASHGTSEFYRWRTAISQRLIKEKGFRFIACEGDWPDCFDANQYIKNHMEDKKATDVLIHSFRRWPTWMWANWEVADLLNWMRGYNSHLPTEKQVGFYGLDVYSLYESLERMLEFAKESKDPELEELTQEVFECFQPYAKQPQKYGRAMLKKFNEGSCGKKVIKLLTQVREKYKDVMQKAGMNDEEKFSAQMNSACLVGAEKYYTVMMSSRSGSWNARDDHMADTLDALMKFHGPDAKCIVWAHNTHIGDARYTSMADNDMRNLGQIVRQRHKDEGVFLVGFGTREGSVIAGSAWDAPWKIMDVPTAPEKSWEYLFSQADVTIPNKLLIFSNMKKEERKLFEDVRGHRAIGVVYNPKQDRYGHWVPTMLGKRYDAFIYLDRTMALHPLPAEVDLSLQPPITYPWGIMI